LDRRLGCPQSRSGRGGEEKNSQPPPEIESPEPRIKRNTEEGGETSMEVDLEVNIEKTKYMVMSRHQNAGQYHNLKISTKPFENLNI
jgi:hypothetical protein